MDAITAILTRRTIRRFVLKPIPEEDTLTILRAGMQAPSADNERPWHFILFKDRGILEEIQGFHESAGMLAEAALAVLVCGEPALQVHPGRWMQDCAAAAENMLLAAHALGYGSAWLGIYPRERLVNHMRRIIGLPVEIEPFAIIAVGHIFEHVPPIDRFDPGRIHTDRWRY